MGINEVSEIMNYCKEKCEHRTCSSCKTLGIYGCEARFIFDLYDIVDKKNLEQNNMYNLLNDIDKKLGELYLYDALDSFAYTILELFLNDRYILTKKENCDELLKECKRCKEEYEKMSKGE